MKITKGGWIAPAAQLATSVPASGVTVLDSGGYFGGPDGLTVEQVLALIGAGSFPDSFLRTTLGGLDKIQNLGPISGTATVDLVNANVFQANLVANTTIATTGWTNGRGATIRLTLSQGLSGGFLPTISGVTWIGAPITAWTTGVKHVLLFSDDGGTTIYGAVMGTGEAASAESVWMPLTTVVGGVPDVVWDPIGTSFSLIPTLVPI